ncbi:MAG: iron chelate uptake ABC transporter family permease subunit, partial [Pseudomonadota bacterium]|nr:iron chelate uptake ABC transporter family permease subunit [Pseudomonadota bacterium]
GLANPAEIPVGLLTSLIGGPYFLWLLIRERPSC